MTSTVKSLTKLTLRIKLFEKTYVNLLVHLRTSKKVNSELNNSIDSDKNKTLRRKMLYKRNTLNSKDKLKKLKWKERRLKYRELNTTLIRKPLLTRFNSLRTI